jgi:CRP/FNR family cyclic AMP-dependent transcriptional regulator
MRTSSRNDLQGLLKAISSNTTSDGLGLNLSTAHWELMAGYLQPFVVAQGQVVIEQGGSDRSVYFVETGGLSVHYEDSKDRVRLAVVGPGSVVGEGAFFSRQPRSATAQAAAPSRLWCLTPLRFTELSNRQPEVALEIAMSLGSIVSRRLADKQKRVAVT